MIDTWLARGHQLASAQQLPAAETCYQEALKLDSRHAEGWLALGNARVRQLNLKGAKEAYQRAADSDPGLADAWFNLGNIECYLGRVQSGLELHRRALGQERDPLKRARLHSNVLLALHRDDALSSEALYREHLAWAQEYASAIQPLRHDTKAMPDSDRPLRIGYVSGSFNGLIVGHFLPHVLERHDPAAVHVTLYSSTRTTDAITQRCMTSGQAWRDIGDMDDATAAECIHADGIDILIDIDGHAPTGRPLLFAHKPAPVQVSWLDWSDTTGLAAMDYVLTDPYTTPERSSQRFIETPYRLPHSRFCYCPPAYAPALASRSDGIPPAMTFGSFNRQDKLHPELFRCWSEILRGVPGSRLLLKNRALAAPEVRSETMRLFGKLGIAPELLILRGPSHHADMLGEYSGIDIALDTYPYNGGLTTCECLWMGVPVVALEGERMIGRQTAALLRLLGLDDWVASSREDYVHLAISKSRQREELAQVRAGLRERMARSPLVATDAFCRDLEAAYRNMWLNHCRKSLPRQA